MSDTRKDFTEEARRVYAKLGRGSTQDEATIAAALTATDKAAHEQGRREMREEAAKMADEYADVNIEAAGDSLLADPILRGGQFTEASIAKSKSLMIDGCVHSSMFHAAQNIAEAIRALPLSGKD